MKDRYYLPNRDGNKNYLEKIGDNEYKLVFTNENTNYRFSKENGEITMIDPSGGPFMCVGQTMSGFDGNITIEKIYNKENVGIVFVVSETL